MALTPQLRRFRIGKTFGFAAAHHLPSLPASHKCSRPHGHTYTVEVEVTSRELSGPGFVADFASLSPLADYLSSSLDHRDLNEVLAFEPTCERLADHLMSWCQDHLLADLPGYISRVRVSESPTSWGEVTLDETVEAPR